MVDIATRLVNYYFDFNTMIANLGGEPPGESTTLIAILFAGTARLLAIVFNGKGTFEALFAICCVAMTLPMFLMMWLPETFFFLFYPGRYVGGESFLFPWPAWVDVTRHLVGILWPLAVIVLGIVLSERFKVWHGVLITLAAAIPLTALMVIFIR